MSDEARSHAKPGPTLPMTADPANVTFTEHLRRPGADAGITLAGDDSPGSAAAAVAGDRDSRYELRGEAEALVSAGHTGAAVAATTVKWRMLPGVERPGIASPLPAEHGITHILDAGANVEAKPRHLVQYAVMGTVYASVVWLLRQFTLPL